MLGYPRLLTWLVVSQAVVSRAKQNCPLYGLGFPKPTNLFQYDEIRDAATALDSLVGQYIDNATNSGSDRFSYSAEAFATNEQTPLWSHYWTAKNLANTPGVKKIDGNTVYRIGSTTKIFTILTFLAEVGDAAWNDPISKYIPEIEDLIDDGPDDTSHSLSSPDWASITIGALASQISGLMRDYSLLGELTQTSNITSLTSIGFPTLDEDEIPNCGDAPTCSKAQFFAGLKKIPPSFSPFTTPAYSDVGYVLLSYALERMTRKTYQQSFNDKIVKGLNLSHTFYAAPRDTLGVIPGDRYSSTWAFNMGNESPTGSVYSSSSDVSAVGRAILKSTLLPAPLTRRWLRPVTWSSDPASSVGSPWGVRRITISPDTPYQFATTFNKLGNIGKYSALLAVIPDFDIGFSILAAGDIPTTLAVDLADTLANTYLPTLQGIARKAAAASYAGRYESASSSVNSSLTITVDATKPGLGVGPWVSNGKDMMKTAVALSQNVSGDYLDNIDPSARLYASGLWDPVSGGGRKVGFRAVFEDLSLPTVQKPYTTDCSTWVSITAVAYGSQPLDLFIFELDSAGRVVAVENAALRTRLLKVS